MKKCTKCWIKTDNFSPDKRCKDWLTSWCGDCQNNTMKQYVKTKEWLSSKIYSRQKTRSRIRNHKMPSYSLKQLRHWLFSQEKFEVLYNNRVESNYDKMLIPSIDRLDDYKWYSFNNIQLLTWSENKAKAHLDMKNWINKKQLKAVIWKHKQTWKKIHFHSSREASRQTKINQWNINSCCNWKLKIAWWYIWSYSG